MSAALATPIAATLPGRSAPAGQPLRALSLAGLVLALWVAVRLPALEHDFAAARAGLAPAALAARTDEPVPALAPLADAGGPDAAVGDGSMGDGGLGYDDLAYAARDDASGWNGTAPAVPRYGPAGRYAAADPAAMTAGGFALPLPTRPLAGAAAAPAPPAPAGSAAAAPLSPDASNFAAAAYARLADGDKRGALRLFNLALASDDGDPRRRQWLADRRSLTRRWSLEAYALVRDPGGSGLGAAASPVLGGGQSGAIVAWRFNPLARRPIALVGRLTAATGNGGQLDNASSQAAFGARWQVLPGVSLSAERLVAIGATARNDWTLRLAAGADGRRGRVHWSAYGEAGVLGSGEGYGGGEARAMVEVVRLGKARFELGPGIWGSVQTGPFTLGRLDIGPSLSTRLPIGRTTLGISADWRQRVAGQALPGSGPVVTLSTNF
jgi:hypothetical protein